MESGPFTKIISVHSHESGGCPICRADMADDLKDPSLMFDAQVNHLLGHGLVLLHVGQQTEADPQPTEIYVYQGTVAVLGVPASLSQGRSNVSVWTGLP
jgi:hypothetical protein